jgi:hypothetical protein
MRVIGAGCFVFGGLLGLVGVAGSTGVLEQGPPWLVGSATAAALLGLVAVAQWLFNPKETDAFGRKSSEQQLRELESRGLLEDQRFRAVRAFGVQEFEDEGLHYYLELADGRVLFLSGQYLYDFEPIDDDPDLNQPRRFPCSEFTVRRHKTEGYVADMQCAGVVLEPEILAPSFSPKDWDADRVPADGQVISDRTYEEVKRERLRAKEP